MVSSHAVRLFEAKPLGVRVKRGDWLAALDVDQLGSEINLLHLRSRSYNIGTVWDQGQERKWSFMWRPLPVRRFIARQKGRWTVTWSSFL